MTSNFIHCVKHASISELFQDAQRFLGYYVPPQSPDALKYERDSSLISHVQYLIDAREYVWQLKPPEEYAQISHAGDLAIGDIRQPAIVNASYCYFGDRYLVSISFPDFTPCQDVLVLDNHGKAMTNNGKLIFNAGFTSMNIEGSLKNLLSTFGVEVARSAKIGHSVGEETIYIEFEARNEDDLRSGEIIVRTFVNSTHFSALQLLHEICLNLARRQPIYGVRNSIYSTPDNAR